MTISPSTDANPIPTDPSSTPTDDEIEFAVLLALFDGPGPWVLAGPELLLDCIDGYRAEVGDTRHSRTVTTGLYEAWRRIRASDTP